MIVKRPAPSRLLNIVITLAAVPILASMAYFIVLGNDVDWDQYFTGAAVDWIGWKTERTPPLWSYFFCGGVTRIADPQAFGLSPLFVLVLLLGPIWGTKAIQGTLFLAGFLFSRQLGLWMLRHPTSAVENEDARKFVASSVAWMIVLSGYMLWRSIVGHYTAYPMYLILGLILFNLMAVTGPLTRVQWVSAHLLGWFYYTTGFYFSLVFLWLPFVLSVSLVLVSAILLRVVRRAPVTEVLRSAGRVAAWNMFALVPGLYKVIPVVQHHLAYPRAGGGWDTQNKILNFLLFQFVPTRYSHLLVGQEWVDPYYSIFEMAAFSPIGWILGGVLLWTGLKSITRWFGRGQAEHKRFFGRGSVLPWVLVAYSFVSVILLLGNFSRWAPFAILNRTGLHESVIITDRFHFSVTVSWALLLLWLIARGSVREVWLRPWCVAGVAVAVLSLYWLIQAFTPWGGRLLREFLDATPAEPVAQVRSLVIAKPVAFIPMYRIVAGGQGFLNCYNHMNRPVAMAAIIAETEKQLWDGTPEFTWASLPLVADRGTTPP